MYYDCVIRTNEPNIFLPVEYTDKLIKAQVNNTDQEIYIQIPTSVSRGFSSSGTKLADYTQDLHLGSHGRTLLLETMIDKVNEGDILRFDNIELLVIREIYF